MSRACRVLKGGSCEVTQSYKAGIHNGIDIVGKNYTCDYLIAHSDGKVVAVRKDYTKNDTTGNSYGNYVKIDHGNGYYTLYAHIAYGTVAVNNGSSVKKGQVIGYMGNTGHSFGAHLHFEVWNGNTRIDPTNYLNADFPKPTPTPKPTPSTGFKVGDKVTSVSNGYAASDGTGAVSIIVTTPTEIKRINSGAKYPYLVGNIGWFNESSLRKSGSSNPVTFKVGDMVKIKHGSPAYNGVALASFVYNNVYRIDELNGKRAVLDVTGICTAVSTDNLIKQ